MTAPHTLIQAPPAAPSSTARNALILIAAVAAGFALYALHGILTPLALALFLMVIIDGFSRVLRQRLPQLSERLAFILAIVLTVVGFVGAAALVAADAGQFLGQIVTDLPRLNRVIAEVGPHVGMHAAPTMDELLHQLDPARYVGAVAQALQGFASGAVLVMIYLGFLFASRQGVRHKTDRLFIDPEEREGARQAFTHIRNGIERYLWVQTVTGLMIAAFSGVVIALVGMDNALFWAFLILVASYVPIIGGLVALILPCLARSDIDVQATGRQSVTVEDSMSMVHASSGLVEPPSPDLKSEVAIVCGMARATLPGQRPSAPTAGPQSQPRPGGDPPVPVLLGPGVGPAGHVPVHTPHSDADGGRRAVPGRQVAGHSAVRGRRPRNAPADRRPGPIGPGARAQPAAPGA